MVDRIKELVQDSNLSYSAFLKEIGLPHSAINEWTKGKAKPSLGAIVKIADYFDVSVDYLLGRDGAKTVTTGDVTNNSGVIGHINAPTTINNETSSALSVQEIDLLNIYRKADGKTQIKIMDFIYKLGEET